MARIDDHRIRPGLLLKEDLLSEDASTAVVADELFLITGIVLGDCHLALNDKIKKLITEISFIEYFLLVSQELLMRLFVEKGNLLSLEF